MDGTRDNVLREKSDLLCSGYRSGVDGERCAYLLGVESTEVADSKRLLFRFSVLQGRQIVQM